MKTKQFKKFRWSISCLIDVAEGQVSRRVSYVIGNAKGIFAAKRSVMVRIKFSYKTLIQVQQIKTLRSRTHSVAAAAGQHRKDLFDA